MITLLIQQIFIIKKLCGLDLIVASIGKTTTRLYLRNATGLFIQIGTLGNMHLAITKQI